MNDFKRVKKYLKITVLLLFLSFVTYEVYNSLKEQETKTELVGPFDAKILDAEDIYIKAGSQTVKLKKENAHWKILEPIREHANDDFLNSWLKKILDARNETLPGSTQLDWAKYGLNDPLASLQITGPGHLHSFIEVSAAKSFDDQYYLRVKNSETSEPKLVISDMNWLEIILKKPLDFISLTKTLDFNIQEVTRVEIRGVGVYTKKDKLWSFKNQSDFDPAKINGLLQTIRDLQIQGYESSQIFKSADLPLKSIYEIMFNFENQSLKKVIIYDRVKPCFAGSKNECQLVSSSTSKYPFWVEVQNLKPILTNTLLKDTP